MAFDIKPLIEPALRRMGVSVKADQLEQLTTYLQLLDKARKKINLVSVDQPQKLITHHLNDSLSVLPYLRGEQVLDFGTGAGFPGLPLACVNAGRHYTLLDSRSRRIEFLTYVCQIAGINNVGLAAQRVQDIIGPNDAKIKSLEPQSLGSAPVKFDTLTARAVAPLQDLISMVAHLTDSGSRLIAMKGQNPEAEVNKLNIERPHTLTIERVSLPDLDDQRHLVIIDFT